MNVYVYENTKIELLSFVRVYNDDDDDDDERNEPEQLKKESMLLDFLQTFTKTD